MFRKIIATTAIAVALTGAGAGIASAAAPAPQARPVSADPGTLALAGAAQGALIGGTAGLVGGLLVCVPTGVLPCAVLLPGGLIVGAGIGAAIGAGVGAAVAPAVP